MTQLNNTAEFFNRFSATFDTIYDERRGPLMRWIDKNFRSDMFVRFAMTFELLGELKGRTLLDIGCGSGPYVLEAFRRGAARVTALDPASRMLDLVRQRLAGTDYLRRCNLIEGSFPGVELAAHDHAIVMGVMDYVADPEDFLKALRAVVGMSAAISFPSKHWLRTPPRKFRYYLRKCPVYFYDEPRIRQLAEASGFGGVAVRKIAGAGMDYHVFLKP